MVPPSLNPSPHERSSHILRVSNIPPDVPILSLSHEPAPLRGGEHLLRQVLSGYTVASRLLHLYSTDDKISRLMMKIFSTVRDTQRGTKSYTEKIRGRREIEVTRKRRGEIKRGESKLASNHYPLCSPQSGSLRDVHGVTQRR